MCIHRNKQIESHPEFGNPQHIDYVKTWQAITAGEERCGEMSEILYDGQISTFKCPLCNQVTHVSAFTDDYIYDFKPIEFECRRCHRDYIIKNWEGDVYFKQPENTETGN